MKSGSRAAKPRTKFTPARRAGVLIPAEAHPPSRPVRFGLRRSTSPYRPDSALGDQVWAVAVADPVAEQPQRRQRPGEQTEGPPAEADRAEGRVLKAAER